MARRFNDPVHLTLTREEAMAVYDAILFVIEEQSETEAAKELRSVASDMERQTTRATYSITGVK